MKQVTADNLVLRLAPTLGRADRRESHTLLGSVGELGRGEDNGRSDSVAARLPDRDKYIVS